MSTRKLASVAVRRQRRGFPRANPCSILTAVFMLSAVVWSHVVFYQSTTVEHLPPSQSGSSARSFDNVSRHQTSPVRSILGQRTVTEHLNASTTGRNSSISLMAELRQLDAAVKRVRARSAGRIIIRSDDLKQPAARSQAMHLISLQNSTGLVSLKFSVFLLQFSHMLNSGYIDINSI